MTLSEKLTYPYTKVNEILKFAQRDPTAFALHGVYFECKCVGGRKKLTGREPWLIT